MRERECIVDIGSSSVGICIFEKEHSKKPLISKTARIAISAGTEEAKGGIETLTIQALGKALDSFRGIPVPRAVHIVLAAPWYHATITTVASRSEKAVKVDEGTVARAVKEYFNQKGGGKAGSTIAESVVSQAYVNGYPTHLKSPVFGTSLRVNHYFSEADQKFKEDVRGAVTKAFPHAKLSFHSFSFVAFAALRAVRNEGNFITIDVGGEITDVAVAHHDGLRYVGTFPIGVLSMVRKIAGTGSIADARSRLSLYAKGELSPEESQTFETAFETAVGEWNTAYQRVLEAAVTEVAVPQTTFLFADREELRWLELLITRQRGSFSSRAIPIVPDFFHAGLSLSEGASYDAFLSAAAVYLNAGARDLIETSHP